MIGVEFRYARSCISAGSKYLKDGVHMKVVCLAPDTDNTQDRYYIKTVKGDATGRWKVSPDKIVACQLYWAREME